MSEATKSEQIPSKAVEELQRAAGGLMFPSETDAALEPFFWPVQDSKNMSAFTSDQLVSMASIPADAPIKMVKLDTFFRPVLKEEDWHNDEEKAEVKRFQELVKTIKETLSDVKVFRAGETNATVYVVGKVEGGYAGLKTNVVET
jgi:hypothetical protein